MPKRMFFIYFFSRSKRLLLFSWAQEQRHLAVVDDGDSRAAQEQFFSWVQGCIPALGTNIFAPENVWLEY